MRITSKKSLTPFEYAEKMVKLQKEAPELIKAATTAAKKKIGEHAKCLLEKVPEAERDAAHKLLEAVAAMSEAKPEPDVEAQA